MIVVSSHSNCTGPSLFMRSFMPNIKCSHNSTIIIRIDFIMTPLLLFFLHPMPPVPSNRYHSRPNADESKNVKVLFEDSGRSTLKWRSWSMIRSFMMKLMFLTHEWCRIAGTMKLRNQTQKEAFNSIKMMIKLLFSDFRCYLFLLRLFFPCCCFFRCFASVVPPNERTYSGTNTIVVLISYSNYRKKFHF